jgi:hypothetical protein
VTIKNGIFWDVTPCGCCKILSYKENTTSGVTHVANSELKGCSSSSLPVRYGAPQGPVLGALLTISCANDIPHASKGRTIRHADDTS